MTTTIANTHLETIADKIHNHERLTAEDATYLFTCETPEEHEYIRQLADQVRQEKAGDVVRFASTLYFYPTNLCELNCTFCSFYAKPGWDKAWFKTPAECETHVRSFLDKGLNEIHIVGGLWRDCNLDYYEELFKRIKSIDPKLHVKALTPVEYDFLAKLHGISIEEVFKKMISWGLGSLPGGGAEILVEELRKKLAPGKITCDEFLQIHELVHSLGINSNVTMLFNHIESYEDIVTHLCRVRETQDKTGGFSTFIPLKFGEEDNALGKRKKQLKKKNIPLVYAVARLMLDNFSHIKALWNYLGVDEALEVLQWGADDLSSTNMEEKVIKMAGGVEVKMDRESMTTLIKSVGRTPLMVHSGAV